MLKEDVNVDIHVDQIIDAKGLACPMPIVRTKKAIEKIKPGEVIEVQATDKGSISDLKAWSKSSNHDYLGTNEDGDVLKHYIRKVSDVENKDEIKHEKVLKLEDLQRKIERQHDLFILDVREPAEFAFGHIPGAKNMPLGQMNFNKLNKDESLYVICRTGNRSDLAAQKLSAEGFRQVFNVVPGMNQWEGQLEKN